MNLGPLSEAPELSVVLPTLGNYEGLRRVLDGFSRQTAATSSFEVVVVVDVADEQPEKVEALVAGRNFEARMLRGTQPGASSNRNVGWRDARAPVVLFTDNDTIPVPRLVAEHIAWQKRYPDEATGVLGHVRWASELGVNTFMRWLDTGYQFDFANIRGLDAGWGRFAGANTSVKRAFIAAVGDFDQEHLPYLYEDTDWAYRASKLGFRLVYNRRAIVDHLRPMDLELASRRIKLVAREEYKFTKLHPELPPWFHRKFSQAAAWPPARGRGVTLAPYVPRWVPWLGRRVWASVDMYYCQQIAPAFLAAWDEAAASGLYESWGPAAPAVTAAAEAETG